MAILETERLILRELTPDDTDAILAVLGDPVALAGWPRTFTRDDITKGWIPWCRNSYRRHGHGLWGIVLKSSGECVGDCGITLQLVEDRAELEIGYHLQHKHWGNGYVTEAAMACRDFAFGKLGLTRLVAMIMPGNTRSRAVAERLGMTVEKEFDKNGIPHLLYALQTRPPEVVLRRSRPEDAESWCDCLADVARERKYIGSTEPIPLENVKKMLAQAVENKQPQYVAVAGGKVAGWCDTLSRGLEGRKHVAVLGMGVHADWRGKRIGSRLLEACLRAARAHGFLRVELECWASNARALELYQRFGFEHEGVKRKARLLDGVFDDAVCMAMLFE